MACSALPWNSGLVISDLRRAVGEDVADLGHGEQEDDRDDDRRPRADAL